MSTATVAEETVPAGISAGRIVKAITTNYLVRRLGKPFFTIVFVTTLVFFLIRLIRQRSAAHTKKEIIQGSHEFNSTPLRPYQRG